MLVDMTDVILECSVCITVTRYSTPTVVSGRVTSQTSDGQFQISAVVAPLPSKDRELLDAGIRAKGTKLVISPEQLYTVRTEEGIPADEFEYQGVTYLIYSVSDWYDLGLFYAYVAVRKDR